MHTQQDGKREQQIAAKADEGLLTDRNQARVAGEQVPQARQRDEGIDFREQPQRLPVTPIGRECQNDEREGDERNADAARPGGMFDAGHPDTFGKKPCGRTARMARNTM